MIDSSMAKPGRVRLERDGAIGWLVIDNPSRHNALSSAMWASLPGLLGETEADAAIRVIVLRGAGGKAFSAGADISEFDTARQGEAARDYDDLNHAAFDALRGAGKPVIAMIEGFCLGGGLALALCCDLRVAAKGSQFAIPPARLGLGYHPRWIKPLLACVSPASAKELLFTGERFGCDTALRMGLINRVFPPEALDSGLRALAQTIAENAPLTIHAAKRTIDAFAADLAPERLDELLALVGRCFDSQDYAEGRRAFSEKRKPVFTGR